ncbi:hypothetical protein V2J91_00980 [Pseudomonas alliivorans]|nr:hypothetical protein [Pseudomonas alliivorans]MEE5144663.1 hypothetical protein [Pseudomonas alliivorans]
MGTIRLRKRKDNTTAYCAQIRINRDGRPVYQETQTFDRKQIDEARMIERDLSIATKADSKTACLFWRSCTHGWRKPGHT